MNRIWNGFHSLLAWLLYKPTGIQALEFFLLKSFQITNCLSKNRSNWFWYWIILIFMTCIGLWHWYMPLFWFSPLKYKFLIIWWLILFIDCDFFHEKSISHWILRTHKRQRMYRIRIFISKKCPPNNQKVVPLRSYEVTHRQAFSDEVPKSPWLSKGM